MLQEHKAFDLAAQVVLWSDLLLFVFATLFLFYCRVLACFTSRRAPVELVNNLRSQLESLLARIASFLLKRSHAAAARWCTCYTCSIIYMPGLSIRRWSIFLVRPFWSYEVYSLFWVELKASI
jgi:hypothetical protein